MSQVHGGVKSKSSAKKRRQRALTRAEAQLKSGIKPFATKQAAREPIEYTTVGLKMTAPLTEHDRKRLEKEIATLKERV